MAFDFFCLISPPQEDPSPEVEAKENGGAPADVVEGVLVDARRDLLNLEREAMWQSANDSMALAAEEAAAAAVAKRPSAGRCDMGSGVDNNRCNGLPMPCWF